MQHEWADVLGATCWKFSDVVEWLSVSHDYQINLKIPRILNL